MKAEVYDKITGISVPDWGEGKTFCSRSITKEERYEIEKPEKSVGYSAYGSYGYRTCCLRRRIGKLFFCISFNRIFRCFFCFGSIRDI